MDETVEMQDAPSGGPQGADKEAWLARIEEVGEDSGYFQPLGDKHWAFFIDEDPVLLVTFETVAAIMAEPDQMPKGYHLAQSKGWSHLCIIADGETWYRDPAVYRYFDRLVDDAFFEDFDRVVFYGTGMGAYAACAYSVTAPGATVLAVQPLATLDPAVTGWDRRRRAARRMNFTDRYGYAPDMVEGAGQVFLLFDPHQPYDAMQAALFTKPFVTMLRTRHVGPDVEKSLEQMSILPELIEAAGENRLTPELFARTFRARRNSIPYLRRVVTILNQLGRPALAIRAARSAVKRLDAPKLRKQLAELEMKQVKANKG